MIFYKIIFITNFVLTAEPIETGWEDTLGTATPESKFSKKFFFC